MFIFITKSFLSKFIFYFFIIFAVTSCCNDQEVPQAIEKLYSSSAKERNKAAMDLSRCGSKAEKAVPKLTELLYDENVGVQSSAAYALRKIDTKNARAALEEAIAAKKRK